MRGRRVRTVMAAAAMVGISLCLYLSGAAAALWSSDQAVHIDGNEIENSTLIIGTHLIHLSGLTEALYKIAQESAQASMQNKTYYKSELAGGTWFDITSAAGLEDISTGGTPVAVEEINGLFLEYHTKSDGVTYDLRTGEAVNIFDIRDPYDLEAMEELQPMKMQYDMLVEKGELGDEEKWCKDQMEELFKTDTAKAMVQVTDEETGENAVYAGKDTEELDQKLEKLQEYLTVLNQYGGGDSEKDVVNTVMESVDASRRLIVYEIVYDLTYKLIETYSGTNKTLPEGYRVDAGVADAVNESISNLNDAITETEGKIISEGDTVLSKERNYWSKELIDDAIYGDMEGCDRDVKALLAVNNIVDGVIGDQQLEFYILKERLLSDAKSRYEGGVGRGENSEYLTAKAGNAASVMLNSIAGHYGNQVNTYRNELEFIIDAMCMRFANMEAQDFVRWCIKDASDLYGRIPSDGFYENCKSSVDDYIRWLNDKLGSLVQGGGGTEADSLKAEKEELQEQYMAALDKNDLEKASDLEKKIEEADRKIQDLSSEQSAEYAGLVTEIETLKEKLEDAVTGGGQGQEELKDELEKELAQKQVQAAEIKSMMTGESAGVQAVKIRQEAMEAVVENPGETELNQIENAIDGLGGLLELDYKSSFPQLTQLYSQMTRERDLMGTGAYDDLIGKAESLILNNKAAYDAAMAERVTADELLEEAAVFFGTEDSSLWTEEQSIVFLAAGEMYLENAMGMSGSGSGSDGQGSGSGSGNGSTGQGENSEDGSGESGTGDASQDGSVGSGNAGQDSGGESGSGSTDQSSSGGNGSGSTGQNGSDESRTGDTGQNGSGESGTGDTDQRGGSGTGDTGQNSSGGGTGIADQSGSSGAGTGGTSQNASGGSGTGGADQIGNNGNGSGETDQDKSSAGETGTEIGDGGQSGSNGSGTGAGNTSQNGGDGSGTGAGSGSDSPDRNGGNGKGYSSIGLGNVELTGELKEIADMMDARAMEHYLSGNPYVFIRLNDPSVRYIPVPLLGNYLNMRYIWNAPKNRATLAQGSRYYEFTLFSNVVPTGKSEAEIITITHAPKIRSVLYVPEDFTSGEFGCSAIYLSGSEYGLLCSDEMREQAEELLDVLLEVGG